MPFAELIEKLKTIEREIPHIVDKTVLDNDNILVDYVVKDQQEDRGIGGTGRSLGEYSPVTIAIKRLKGQPTSHITGRDTGRMHRTSHVRLRNHKFSVEHTGEDYMEEFEERYEDENPYDITEDNLDDFIIHFIEPDLIKGIQRIL